VSHLTPDDRQQVLNALKRNTNGRPGWDLPPEWGAVYRADTGRMRCAAFPVPWRVWDYAGHPNNVLASYRDFMAKPRTAQQRAQAQKIRDAVPGVMVGMYLTYEGWAPPEHKTRAMYEMDPAQRPAFKDLPDRVETRFAGAVDLDSALYLVLQPRPTMRLEGAVDDLTPGVTVTGAQSELLYALLHLFLKQPA
jgi:hypothetical protein